LLTSGHPSGWLKCQGAYVNKNGNKNTNKPWSSEHRGQKLSNK